MSVILPDDIWVYVVCVSVMWARGCVVNEYGTLSVVDQGAAGVISADEWVSVEYEVMIAVRVEMATSASE